MCVLYIGMHVHNYKCMHIVNQSALSKYPRRVSPYANILYIYIVPSHVNAQYHRSVQ